MKHNVLLIKALEDGVSVIFTSPEESHSAPPERLDKGEVLIIAAPEDRDGIRVRGHAEVYSPHHVVHSESGLVIGGRSDDSPPKE
jgi:hypothetical protein